MRKVRERQAGRRISELGGWERFEGGGVQGEAHTTKKATRPPAPQPLPTFASLNHWGGTCRVRGL